VVYDWDGVRTKRLKFYKTTMACLFATAVIAVSFFALASQLHNLGG
jgi:hypothetical protein